MDILFKFLDDLLRILFP